MFQQAPLPYPHDALEPSISRETLEYHHGKHHRAYVDKLNALVEGTQLQYLLLEDVILTAGHQSARGMTAIFDNAAQAWNHAFYWNCLTPEPSRPTGILAKAIDTAFGSLYNLYSQFNKAALARFGSGWTWLVKDDDGALEIMNTGNAGSPLPEGKIPLLVCDVWEHAYYLDYRHERAEYLKGFWDIVNWKFVAENFTRDGLDLRVA
jgi:superoxide dismutase, Fe-Mn family